jgi:methionine sulfoxide reductase catalytic subunit
MATHDPPRGGPGEVGLPGPSASKITPDSLEEFRRKLATGGEDVVDPRTWSGSLPNQWGTAPMLRVGRSKWFNLLWLAPIEFGLLIIGVVVAQALRELPSVQAFIEKYPGNIPPPNGVQGVPAWANRQHFFNLFLMTFIIRSAVQILTDHPRLYWTRHSTPGRDWFRFQRRCRWIHCGLPSRTQ